MPSLRIELRLLVYKTNILPLYYEGAVVLYIYILYFFKSYNDETIICKKLIILVMHTVILWTYEAEYGYDYGRNEYEETKEGEGFKRRM